MIVFYIVFCGVAQRPLPLFYLPLQPEQPQIQPQTDCWPAVVLAVPSAWLVSTRQGMHFMPLDSRMGPTTTLNWLSLHQKLNTQITPAPYLAWNWLEIHMLLSGLSWSPRACSLVCNPLKRPGQEPESLQPWIAIPPLAVPSTEQLLERRNKNVSAQTISFSFYV